jgi:dTDP-4-dehydrorhamnose reductase
VRLRRRNHLLFVTGGSGLLGHHLLGVDLPEHPGDPEWQVYAPPSNALDIRNPAQVADQIHEWRPTTVVHLAYRKDDRAAIVAGSTNVARAAAAVGAHLVHLSTDVVFGGRPTPYVESDVPSPVDAYGRWKAEAEAAVLEAHPGALVIRTSLLYGTSRLATIQRDVDAVMTGRSPMRFFVDELRCPVAAVDVASAISRLAHRRDVHGVLHVAGPEAMSRADLARRFAAWQGHDPAQVPTASVVDAPTPRAAHVVLDSSRANALGIAPRRVDDVLVR